MEKSIKSSSINYGLYLALLLTLFTVLAYAFNIELLVNFWIALLILPLITIIFGIVSTAKAKSLLGGYMSFKEAFSAYFIAVAIGILISSLVSIILFGIVDPEAADYIKEIGIEKARAFMEKMGAPQSQIDEALAEAAKQDTMSVGAQTMAIAKGLIFYAVIGLIVALSMKKKDPNVA